MLSCLHSHSRTLTKHQAPSQGFSLPACTRTNLHLTASRWGCHAQRLLQVRARGVSRDHGWDDDRWGPYSQVSSGSTYQRLFNQALSTPLGDLSLDFDRNFINSRRRSSCVADAATIAEAELDDMTVGRAERRTKNRRTTMMAERDEQMCDVLLEFQRLVAGQGLGDALLTAADLLSRHTSGRSHTETLKAEVQRLADLVHCQMASTLVPSVIPDSMFPAGSGPDTDTAADEEQQSIIQPVSQRAAALVQAINRVMYSGPDGYCGNCHDFYHPDNHLLYKVVENRTGSPAALALLYWEVARRVGLPMEVMLLPGHTFLRPMVPGGSSWLVDPFNGGQVCSQQVVEARLNSNWGLAAPQLSLPNRYHPLATPPLNPSPNGQHAGVQLHTTQQSRELHPQTQQVQQSSRMEVPLLSDVADASGCTAQFEEHTHCGVEDAQAGAGAGTETGQSAQGQGQEQMCRAAGGISFQPTFAPGTLLLRLLCNQRESYYCPLPASGFIRWGGGTASAHLHQMLVWRGLWTTRLLRAMVPGTAYLVRDEGYALLQLGNTKEGMDLLRMYLRCAEGAEDLRRVQEFIVPD